jgi:hypothetical protein
VLAITTTLATVTTASFTPPGGAVLACLVLAGGTGAGTGITMTITDTSGLGLTWTQRAVSSSSDNFQPAFIVTTTIPAGGNSATAVLAAGAGAALGPAVVTSNVVIGPKYAGTATDLGGVYGSWGTPQFATGGP